MNWPVHSLDRRGDAPQHSESEKQSPRRARTRARDTRYALAPLHAPPGTRKSLMEVRIQRGPAVLGLLGSRLDELHEAIGAPITARTPWLATWIDCHPFFEPIAFWI